MCKSFGPLLLASRRTHDWAVYCERLISVAFGKMCGLYSVAVVTDASELDFIPPMRIDDYGQNGGKHSFHPV